MKWTPCVNKVLIIIKKRFTSEISPCYENQNMKSYTALHCVHMRRKVFPCTEISLVDRRDLGDRDNVFPI